MVERARLESVYTPKVYRGFESLPLRKFISEKPLYVTYKGFSVVNNRKGHSLGHDFIKKINIICFSLKHPP